MLQFHPPTLTHTIIINTRFILLCADDNVTISVKTESVWRDAGCPSCNLLVLRSSRLHSCMPSVKLLYSILDRSIFVFRISCQRERGSMPTEDKEISTELTRRPDAAITSSSSNITGSALRRNNLIFLAVSDNV